VSGEVDVNGTAAAQDRIVFWRYNPYLFVIEVLGAKPLSYREQNEVAKVVTTQQRQVLEDVGKLAFSKKCLELNKMGGYEIRSLAATVGLKISAEEVKMMVKKTGVSIKSGKGPGKTTLEAWLTIWFLMCFPGSIVPCTASKLDQVKDVLWREISKWIKISADKGSYGPIVKDSLTVQGEKIFVKGHSGEDGKEWFAIARSASTAGGSDSPAETLQGFHAQYMMIIVDEATGVPDNVFMPLESTLSDPVNFLIMTYNPTRTSGFAYRSQHRDKEEWLTYRWNCEDSENVSKESIERVARKYGRDSNAYRISVLGLEPVGDSDSVMPLEWVMAAVNRDIVVDDDDPIISCVDLARQGDDKSVILTRQSMKVDPNIKSFNGQNTMEMAGWISLHIAEEEPTCTGLDVIGMGYGVLDRLREVGHRISGINVSESTSRKEKFERLRDELWWKCRKAFEEGIISIPDDEELIFELSNTKYKVESNGKIKIESKREMRKRGVASPNKADALVLTFYFNDRSYRTKSLDDKYQRARMKSSNHVSDDAWMGV
tara:strand:- start:13828 stop:15459 length:1632 start_codon:yes stop_codon:yes gene_type:complete